MCSLPMFQIRGMTVDEAIKQLSLAKHKGAHIIKEVRSYLNYTLYIISLLTRATSSLWVYVILMK
jgi:hypothetical protein